MAVGYRSSSSTGLNDALASSVNVPVPSGAASGDIALVAVEQWEVANPTVTPPSGFTQLAQVVSGSQKLKVFWKRLTGADTGTYAFTWTGSQWNLGHCVLLTGAIASGDPIGAAFNTATATSTAIPVTTVTVAFQPGLAHFVANENSGTQTAPASFTEVQDSNYLHSNYRIPGSTGTFATSGGSLTASTLMLVVLLAVEPAGAGGTDLDLADSPTAIRAHSTTQTIAIGFTLTDQSPGATRSAPALEVLAVGKALADSLSATRATTLSETLAIGVVLADPTSGTSRAGGTTGETATTALILADSTADTSRAGSTAGTSTIDVLYIDSPGATRGASTTDSAAAELSLSDRPTGVRAGAKLGETATAALTIFDPDTGQIRAATSLAAAVALGTGLTDPITNGARLGGTPGSLTFGISFTDSHGAARARATATTVAATVVLVDISTAARLAGTRDALVDSGPVTRGQMSPADRLASAMSPTDRTTATMGG